MARRARRCAAVLLAADFVHFVTAPAER